MKWAILALVSFGLLEAGGGGSFQAPGVEAFPRKMDC